MQVDVCSLPLSIRICMSSEPWSALVKKLKAVSANWSCSTAVACLTGYSICMKNKSLNGLLFTQWALLFCPLSLSHVQGHSGLTLPNSFRRNSLKSGNDRAQCNRSVCLVSCAWLVRNGMCFFTYSFPEAVGERVAQRCTCLHWVTGNNLAGRLQHRSSSVLSTCSLGGGLDEGRRFQH